MNAFKDDVLAGAAKLGIWSSLCNPLLAEIIGEAGFDWVLFDMEHAPNDLQLLIAQLQAIKGSHIEAVVRPQANDPVAIKRVLDIGFRNVLIPYVQNASEAAGAVAATRYPPKGIRGVSAYHRNNKYGRQPDYFRDIDDRIGVFVQVETREAMDAISDIAAVPGVDAIFVGPGDLAASMGCLGNIRHADVQKAIREIAGRCAKAGIVAGIVAGNAEDAERYLAWGYRLMTIGSDVALVTNAIYTAAETARGIAKPSL